MDRIPSNDILLLRLNIVYLIHCDMFPQNKSKSNSAKRVNNEDGCQRCTLFQLSLQNLGRLFTFCEPQIVRRFPKRPETASSHLGHILWSPFIATVSGRVVIATCAGLALVNSTGNFGTLRVVNGNVDKVHRNENT